MPHSFDIVVADHSTPLDHVKDSPLVYSVVLNAKRMQPRRIVKNQSQYTKEAFVALSIRTSWPLRLSYPKIRIFSNAAQVSAFLCHVGDMLPRPSSCEPAIVGLAAALRERHGKVGTVACIQKEVVVAKGGLIMTDSASFVRKKSFPRLFWHCLLLPLSNTS